MAKAGITLPNNFDNLCNCTYTSGATGSQAKISIATLMELMNDIPETPRIFKMDIFLKHNQFLPKNTILISSDIADVLEQALEGNVNHADQNRQQT